VEVIEFIVQASYDTRRNPQSIQSTSMYFHQIQLQLPDDERRGDRYQVSLGSFARGWKGTYLLLFENRPRPEIVIEDFLLEQPVSKLLC